MKKIINKTISAFLILAFLTVSGCSGKPLKFDQFNQNIDKSKIDFENGREMTVRASGFQLLLFIPIATNGRQNRAYKKLVKMARGGYITDIKIQEKWTYAFVGTVYGTRIKAMVYPYKQ